MYIDVEKQALVAVTTMLGKQHLGYELRQYYDWLKSPKGYKLQLDLYLPTYGIAIEVDGEQHYKYPNRYHKSVAQYKYQLACDRAKERQCKERGIELIRIRGKLLKAIAGLKGPKGSYLKTNLCPLGALNRESTAEWNRKLLISHLMDISFPKYAKCRKTRRVAANGRRR